LLEILLTGNKAFQSIARDKGLKMQITREKECVQFMLCLLRWSVQTANRHKPPEEMLWGRHISEDKSWSGPAIRPKLPGPLAPHFRSSELQKIPLVLPWLYSTGWVVLY
jgi:hypothetical protein